MVDKPKKPISINMEFLGKSRKKVRPGDIFAFKLKPLNKWYFGRVIRTDASVATAMPIETLVYIYNVSSDSKDNIPELDKKNLLIPPSLINNRGWLDGYFTTVDNKELTSEDVLERHCFRDGGLPIVFEGRQYPVIRYYDEDRNEIKDPDQPCGRMGIGNHRTLDDDISEALGIPPAPIDEEDLR